LILADLGAVERRLEKLDSNIKKLNRAEDVAERALFLKMKDALEAEKPLRELELSDEERRRLRNYSFLTEKPILLVVNVGEDQMRNAGALLESSGLAAFANAPGRALCPVAATIEAEVAQLSPEDARAFREDLGLDEPGLDRVIRTSYALLGLVSFLTAGEDECRAWTIRRGTRAQAAAGTIHSDIERGFIRAEVVAFDDLVAAGSLAACREKGTLRLEGKEYVVRDGDVINFRFNV
jgi:ribosome-binding ATPase